ncbi:invasion associated locus B family protein [Ochrobactrum sp. Marseille-Q0166]|uniref:invasion associated locus B family protein n=1 Tax=Ochrobactrum sp. Marseille-Q0166 TaxID=2761105 RepID=UPI0016567A1C|nr:invasion associated locus B family protein [Ochrobactrum sp. Marseille-Q0166]MBC8718333.1 invasion associated locus B family protein [Ochrobactrum sp. Marseille-Q0166]
MHKRAGTLLMFLVTFPALLFLCSSSFANKATQSRVDHSYKIKPSGIQIPSGINPGEYRRVIEPFPNWTLICDENLKSRVRVCNITQNIVDEAGSDVFSWSLATMQNGQPTLILRVPPVLNIGDAINLRLDDHGSVVAAKVDGCNKDVCVAYQSVGPRLRAAIKKGAFVDVIYANRSAMEIVAFNTSLKGLSAALAGVH